MKRSRLSYDEWKCIKSKKLKGNQINTEFFKGYIGIIEIEEVSEKQNDIKRIIVNNFFIPFPPCI